jgi:hypothetical protein
MTVHDILAILVAVVVIVGGPVILVWSIVAHLRTPPSKRRHQGGGSMTAGIGAAMQELDRLYARPSAEHRVEAETPVLRREDDQGGD